MYLYLNQSSQQQCSFEHFCKCWCLSYTYYQMRGGNMFGHICLYMRVCLSCLCSDFWKIWPRNFTCGMQVHRQAIIIIIIITTTIFMALSSWRSAIARVHLVHLMNADSAPDGANPQTKPIDLGCESADGKAAVIHIHHRHFIITQPKGWYSFYHPIEGKRLSRPRHCSKGAHPVPKAVYRSGCHDKHNRPRWDSNLGPFTPQSDALTTRPLRPAVVLLTSINQAICIMLVNCLNLQ